MVGTKSNSSAGWGTSTECRHPPDQSPLPPKGPPPPEGVNPDAISPKVLLYVFDPIMENMGGLRQHEAYGWRDPLELTQQVNEDLRTSSHGLVDYQVVDTKVVDGHPYFVDGFQHTDETFDEAWLRRDFHLDFGFDYLRFCAENNIAERIDSGEIDEVWIYAAPINGMYESVMAGRGAYWINGAVQDVDSDRAFAIMGWNFERGVAEALHSYAHRAEWTMAHMYGPQAPILDNNWNKFTFQDRYAPGLGQGGIGNIHFPVNGEHDYDYNNERFVLSNADDWYNYPDFQGITRSINYRAWSPEGIDPHREYLNWWYDHLPHFGGRGDDFYLNNWWRYITDLDQFKDSNGNLYQTSGIPTVDISSVATDSAAKEIDVTASASADGALGRVDLYIDHSYSASDTLAPYTFNVALARLPGTHTLIAKAYKLQNGTEAVSDPAVYSTRNNSQP